MKMKKPKICNCYNCKYERVKKRLDKLYNLIEKETTEKGIQILNKIVNLEIKAEQYCNI